MELKPEKIKEFIELHKDIAGFDDFTEEQVREIANGVANYYLTLFKISQRIRKEEKEMKVIEW